MRMDCETTRIIFKHSSAGVAEIEFVSFASTEKFNIFRLQTN